jgi:hypothetical protein
MADWPPAWAFNLSQPLPSNSRGSPAEQLAQGIQSVVVKNNEVLESSSSRLDRPDFVKMVKTELSRTRKQFRLTDALPTFLFQLKWSQQKR